MICVRCMERTATERHHIFPQTKKNRELYGSLLDSQENIQMLCYACHHGHNGIVKHMSETEFCLKMGIEPRSKSGKL